MQYHFDEFIDRNHTSCMKYDMREKLFGTSDVIPMWVADMDFKTPDFIANALQKRLDHPIYGYSFRPSGFYDSAVSWMQERHQWKIIPEDMVFSPGVVPGLNLAVELYTSPGDSVIIQPPVYFPFFSAIKNQGRNIIYNELQLKNNRYFMNFDDLKKQIDHKTKMIFLCNPHNPGGMVWTKEELSELATICLQHNILIISDEIHSDLIFPGHKHIPMASLSEEVANQTITFMAPSKTFNLAGLSTSFAIIQNNALRDQFNNAIHQMHLHNGNIFGNVALEAAYSYGGEWVDQLMQYLDNNLNFIKHFVQSRIPTIELIMPEATYLVWMNCKELKMNNKSLKDFMIHKAGLGLSDGFLFGPGGNGFQRMNIGCPAKQLKQALEQLEKAVNNI